jgi:hypothetical protein
VIDVREVQDRLRNDTLVKDVSSTAKGHVRIETAFLYPEGSNLDLFLVDEAPLFPPRKLSDLGQTQQWLLDLQLQPWLSKKRQAFIDDALRIYGVKQNAAALELPLPSLDELSSGIIHLGQACVRVADLIYTRRSSLQAPIFEEVEEVIADAQLAYEPNPKLEGRFGKLVQVDFLVSGARARSAVLTLSSPNASQAHVQANEIFRRWYDLDAPVRTEQRVTIFDDRNDSYRDEDLQRLRDKSMVLALSERTAISELLAA